MSTEQYCAISCYEIGKHIACKLKFLLFRITDKSRNTSNITGTKETKSRELLEVKQQRSLADELASITKQTSSLQTKSKATKVPENSPHFIDNPDVPPLI